MRGKRIEKVIEHCAKFGEKFFEENGKRITLIKFGAEAKEETFRNQTEFLAALKLLKDPIPGTKFAGPLKMLKGRIVADNIKELLVVFLTDGENFDPKQTQTASDELKTVLDGIYSKFNVIGLGNSFNVQTLENLVKSGTQSGIVSSDIEKAFTKIYETFE